MKVIIVTLIKGSFPFIGELSSQLNDKEIEVELFDMFDMYTLKMIEGKQQIDYHLKSNIIRRICGISFLGTILRLVFYKCYFVLRPLRAEHITIHYVLPFYSFFMNAFKKESISVSCCIWGSDFYRISNKKKDNMRSLFSKCDSIIIGNLNMANEFSNYYNDFYFDKIRYVGFGIGKLDLIQNLKQNFLENSLKESINLPNDKLIITIGYNGIEAQQHLLILDAFEKLTKDVKNNIFIVIPFGYGGDLIYKNIIKAKLENLDIGYIIFDDFISDEDVAKIRISTNLVINAQISDASSASIQEHLYSNNVLLAGEWLPYEYFSNKGIKFWTFKMDNLEENVFDILNNFYDYSDKVKLNKEKVYELSSWNSRIHQWINVFSQ
jgi:hypothetical protein